MVLLHLGSGSVAVVVLVEVIVVNIGGVMVRFVIFVAMLFEVGGTFAVAYRRGR